MRHLARPRSYEWRWELDASPQALWPLVADTDRFNRDTGLPPVTDARAPGEVLRSGRRHLRMRVRGVPVEWEESPFEWVAPTRFGVVRRYHRGPLREMHVQVELEPAGADRTVLTYRVQAWPRGLFGTLTVPLQIGVLSRRAFGRALQRYAREAQRVDSGEGVVEPTYAPLPGARPQGLSDLGSSRLRALAARLYGLGHDRGLVELLVRHIEQRDEGDLTRIRPYALADAWREDRRTTLRLLLHAAREGMLDLRWDVICPLCRGSKEKVDALDRLPEGRVHCATCMVDFETNLERSVELTFVPSAGIRAVQAGVFCVAGPRTTPHVLIQQLLAPSERREVQAPLPPGHYRVRTLDGSRSAVFAVDEGAGERLAGC